MSKFSHNTGGGQQRQGYDNTSMFSLRTATLNIIDGLGKYFFFIYFIFLTV